MCDHCGCHEVPAIAHLSAEHEAILRVAWERLGATERSLGAATSP